MTDQKEFHPRDEFLSHCKELPAELQAKLSIEDIQVIYKIMVRRLFIREVCER